MAWWNGSDRSGQRGDEEFSHLKDNPHIICRLKRRLKRCFHSHEYIIAFPLFPLRDTGKLNSDMQQTHTTTNAAALIYNGQLATAGL